MVVDVVHEVWQRFLTTRKVTTALTLVYCGTNARLAIAFLESTTCTCSMQMTKGRKTVG